jgi:hypothetical protein
VQIDRIAAGLRADAVTVDNIFAAHQCVTRLILSGHRKIGCLGELEMSYLGDLPASSTSPTGRRPSRGRYVPADSGFCAIFLLIAPRAFRSIEYWHAEMGRCLRVLSRLSPHFL